jgi:hypothetical protein
MTALFIAILILLFIFIRLLYRRIAILEQQVAHLLSKDAQREAARSWTVSTPKQVPKVPTVKGVS